MKSINIVLIVSVLIFNSCKKKSNTSIQNQSTTASQPSPTVSIVNAWKYSALYYSNDNGATWTLDGAPVSPDVLTFSSNGSYNCPTRDFTRLGQVGSAVADNGSYTNTDSLTISSNVSGKVLKTKIVKLTDTELWLRYSCKCYEVRFTKN